MPILSQRVLVAVHAQALPALQGYMGDVPLYIAACTCCAQTASFHNLGDSSSTTAVLDRDHV